MERLRDINPTTLGVDETVIYRILRCLPETANREELLELLPDDGQTVREIFRSHAEPAEGYKIRQICVYGVTECIRADMAAESLKAGAILKFGELIDLSHDADRVTRIEGGKRVPTDNSYPDEKIDRLTSDLVSGNTDRAEAARLYRQPGGYDVSVPEVDEMVDIAKATPGVCGAGLVGAGLGGSIVAIVHENSARQLIDNLTEQYYRPRRLPVHAEIVTPVGGAGVLEV
jgi:galactokinase